MDIITLGEKIRKKRKEKNLTLKNLAGDRITSGQISLIESGKSKPSVDLLYYLASKLDVTVEYLMESEKTQAEKICIYYKNIADFYLAENNLESAEKYVETCAFYAEKYNLDYEKGLSYYIKGEIYSKRGNLIEANGFFLSANSSFIRLKKFKNVVSVYINLGIISIKSKSYHAALSYFEQGEKAFSDGKLTDPFIIGEIYYYLAFIYYRIEDLEKSLNFSYLAKEELKNAVDRKTYGKSLELMSEQYAQNGNLEKAIEYSKLTNNIYEQIGDLETISDFENNLGKLFYDLENLDESFNHYYKALNIRKETKGSKLIETYINLCENYIRIKNTEKAEEILEEIADLLKGESHYTYDYYILCYKLSVIQGDDNKIEYNLFMALKSAEGEKDSSRISEVSIKLGKYYSDIGDSEKALKYLNSGVDILKDMGIL